ncbi:hypothetical protein MA16_Dca000463 [Dendrobium catenatum]|uniref:Uncharacterized protein n=1 Tax=Dendrobium catenatum TaxID=906689 RepID=A0A2I0WTX1_9ASPA|nr:hypothetical protein MA16_Dca000463 [Dendrobium catenatum]
MQINSKTNDALRKLLLRGEFDAFPDDEQMHGMAQLAKNLHAYVTALPNNIPTKESAFLLEVSNGFHALSITKKYTNDRKVYGKASRSGIENVLSAGVKMPSLNSMDKTDPAQCRQAAR